MFLSDILLCQDMLSFFFFAKELLTKPMSTSMFAKVSGDKICKLKHIEWTIDTSIQYCKWF